MANNNNIDGVVTTNNPQLLGSGYKLPNNFNNSRQPGELASLFEANSDIIYNKFNPRTGYSNSLLNFGPNQPFIVSNPNNHSSIFSTRSFPLGSALTDLERITKWQATGDGIMFIGKQLFLQGQNVFNETKIYNPLLPIQSVASKLSFGLIPTPTRFIDLSSGFSSILGFGSSDKPISTTVASTGAGTNALSDRAKSVSNPYKGLLRGVTASDAYNNINKKWQGEKSNGVLSNYFKSGFNRIFGGLIPVGQPANTYYRADEGMYGIMLGAKDKFKTTTNTGDELKWGTDLYQRWEAGSNTESQMESIKKESQTSIRDNKKVIKIFNKNIPITSQYFGIAVGYQIEDNNNGYKIYGDNVGIVRIKKQQSGETSYEYSDILNIYNQYVKDDTNLESKFTDETTDSVKNIHETLQKVIKNINLAGYSYSPVNNSDKMMQQFSDASFIGLNNITHKTKDPFSDKKGISPKNYNGGYMTRFKDENLKKQLVDDNKGKGFATTNQQDKINKLEVLNSSEFGENKKYNKDNDDLIAFYIHDLTNDKYLPFRSTIKNLGETLNVEWNDVLYIGRADKLYTYKGFTRTVTFNLLINIASVSELLPTWQRINYLMGLAKPANYTANKNYPSYSRFIIPPFIEFTLGDLYSDQPSVLTSLALTVPEDASWETLNENYAKNNDWSYLNGLIQLKDSKKKYAQLPRTVDVSISMNLLEKEKPIVGGAHFGSSYRKGDNYNEMVNPETFSSKLIVNPL